MEKKLFRGEEGRRKKEDEAEAEEATQDSREFNLVKNCRSSETRKFFLFWRGCCPT